MFAAGSDPEIWKVHPAPDRYTEPEFRKYFDGAIASKMAFVFVDRSERTVDRIEPLLRLRRRAQRDRDRLDLCRPQYWGGATNREVKRLMLDHAFSFVDTVIFWVGEKNWRSQGAMKKIGGVLREGRFTRECPGRCRMSSSKSKRAGISRVAGRWWREVQAAGGERHDLLVAVGLLRLREEKPRSAVQQKRGAIP